MIQPVFIVTYDLAPDPCWISLYMMKILSYFLWMYNLRCVNSWKIFPRSCNWACTLKNPCCGGWKISVGRLLLINLLGCSLPWLVYLIRYMKIFSLLAKTVHLPLQLRRQHGGSVVHTCLFIFGLMDAYIINWDKQEGLWAHFSRIQSNPMQSNPIQSNPMQTCIVQKPELL